MNMFSTLGNVLKENVIRSIFPTGGGGGVLSVSSLHESDPLHVTSLWKNSFHILAA